MCELKFCPDTKILVIEKKWKSSKENPKIWGNFSEKIPGQIFDIKMKRPRVLEPVSTDIYQNILTIYI